MTDVHVAMRRALRARLQTAVRLTVGPLSNITVGTGGTLTRSSGSWLTDGFLPGEVLTASGFAQAANNGTATIKAVTASVLTLAKTTVAEAAGASVDLFVGLPAVAWEGRAYSPVVGTPFLREQLNPLPTYIVGFGAGGLERHPALYLLDLLYPFGFGPSAAEAMAGTLRQLFPPGLVLTADGQQVRVAQASRSALRPEADWMLLPLTIRVEADAPAAAA